MGGLGTAVRTPEVAQWPDFARITTGKNMQKTLFFKFFKMDVFDPRLSGSGPNGLKMIGDEVETPRGPWKESWTPVVVPGRSRPLISAGKAQKRIFLSKYGRNFQ